MHKKFSLLSALVLAGLSASCVDLKEELVSGITDKYYLTPVGFDALINASYEPLRSFYGQERGFTVTVFGTDEYTKGADGSNKYINDYDTQLNGDAGIFRDTWTDFYRAINTTNAAIGRAKNVNITDVARAGKVAEARYLRAFYYFHLIQMYGDVTLILDETTAPSTIAKRDPKAKIYDAIIADLTYAAANLPDVQKEFGRVTRPAVWFLLSKVYLTRAQAGDMALAATNAKLVINSGLFTLLPRYADVFDFKNQRNKEVVWSVQFTADPLTTGPGNSGHLYFLMEYDKEAGMTRDTKNGRPFKRFRPTNYLLGLWDRTKDGRYDDMFLNVFYSNNAATIPKKPDGTPKFAVGDTAFWLPGVEVSDAVRAAAPYRIYTPKEYSNRIFPTLNKFLDGNRLTQNDTRGSRDYMVFRYAEAYLIAAEALFRDGKSDEAVSFVNAVRRRAAKKGSESAMEVGAGDLSIDFFLDERARELTGETMRWFDLVRTGKLVERVKKYNPEAAAFIKDYHVLRPIPNTQLDRTTGGYLQNPGY